MKASKKSIMFLLTVFTVAFLMGGCNPNAAPESPFVDEDRKYVSSLSGICCDYKFEKKEQDVDSAEMTLFLGYDRKGGLPEKTENYADVECKEKREEKFASVAIFFKLCEKQGSFGTDNILGTPNIFEADNREVAEGVEDYKSIPDLFLIKEFSREEFNDKKFLVKEQRRFMRGSSRKYGYSEKTTIPKEIFARDEATVIVIVCGIYQIADNGKYTTNGIGRAVFDYKKTDEKTVEITSWRESHVY